MNDQSLERRAAASYEDRLVPALFEQWPARVLDAADVGIGHRVLDVACGTGVLARHALERVGAAGFVIGVDPSPGMLAEAAQRSPEVDWRQGVAAALPCADASVDRVVSQFGLMFFPDRVAALADMLRVLVPGGRLAVAVWDGLERTPGFQVLVDLLERRAGSAAADVIRAPFVFTEAAELAGLLSAAGAADGVVTTVAGEARFASARDMLEADLRGWLPLMGVELEEALINQLFDEGEQALAPWTAADGSVVFPAPAHIATASKG